VSAPELEEFREKLDREMRTGLLAMVLLAAIDRLGPAYGYGLLRSIEERSRGRVVVGESTAYPLLQRLEKAGLVRSRWREGDSGPPRKYYEATSFGRYALERVVKDWRALTRDVEALLGDLEREAER